MMKVENIGNAGGVSVEGVDLSAAGSAQENAAIADLFDAHGLVVFKRQSLTKHQLVEAGARFVGTLIKKEAVALDPEAPGITVMSTRGPFGDVVPKEPEEIVGDIDWHTDQGYVTAPIRGKILYAVEVPPEGGRTGFIDGQLTYAELPDDLKRRIEGLHVIQSWNKAEPYVARNRDYRIDGNQLMTRDRFPDLAYPIVYDHPKTGAKVLNTPPLWSAGIVEMPGRDGEELLDALVGHVVQPRFQYWHSYEVGDAVLWDNWRFLHAAGGTPGRHVRTMWCINLQGAAEIGRALPALAG